MDSSASRSPAKRDLDSPSKSSGIAHAENTSTTRIFDGTQQSIDYQARPLPCMYAGSLPEIDAT